DKLTKYANGYKAIFNIGNPNYVTFSGLKVNIGWTKADNIYEINKNGKNKLRTAEITINKPILPGIWNKVAVILSPAKSDDINLMILSITTNEILLSKDYRKSTS
ncbi:hypothetical protein, partial [Legionella parisiensis]